MRSNRGKVISVTSWPYCQQHFPELTGAFKCHGKGIEQSSHFLKHRSSTLHWKTGFSSSPAHMWHISGTGACHTLCVTKQCVCRGSDDFTERKHFLAQSLMLCEIRHIISFLGELLAFTLHKAVRLTPSTE